MRGINKSHWVGGLLLAGVLLTGTGRAQLADGPWPMFRHDQRHTGQSPYVGPSEVNLAWTFVGEDEGLGEPVIGPTGTIYVGARNGRIGGRDKRKFYALHPDGSIKWTFSCESSEEKFRSAPAIGIDGTIYFASTLYFYAVNDSGFLKWKHELPSDSSPVIGGDGTLYVPDARRLYAFDLNGNVKWTYDTGGTSTMTSPAIGPDGSIYVVARGLLYSISPQGKLNWIYEFFPAVPGQWVNNGPTIGTDGTIYVTSYDNGYIIAVNPDSTEKWHLNLKGSTGGSWLAIGSDGTIYVSTRKPYTLSPDTTRFCALNPDGSIKWKIDDIHLISPAIGSDGTIYGGSWEGGSGKFYAVTSDGNLKWTYDITGPRSPAIDKDGTLYLSSGRGRLYAFFRKNPETSPDPSVAPGSMTFDPQTSTPNNQVRITATIEELTDTQAATCDIIFYYDDKTNPIDTVATYLPPGWKRNVEVVWNTQGLEVRDYTIIAEISNASPAESNLSNNEGEAVYTFVPLIQPRIDAAQEGDTVWVDPGVYFENLTLKNGLVLKSRSGPEVTIINAQKRDVTIKAEGWEFDSTTVVEGFTITNGSGGLLLRQSSPIIRNNIIVRNDGGAFGGGISLFGPATPLIERIIDDISIAADDTQHIEIPLSPVVSKPSLYPPRNLAAAVDSDDSTVVNLQWGQPIEEMAFDDGIFESAFMFTNVTGFVMNGPFIPTHYPCTLDKALAALNWDREGDSFRVWILIDSTSASIDPIDSLWVVGAIDEAVGPPCYFQEFDLTEFHITLGDSVALYLAVQQLCPSPQYTFIEVDDNAPEGRSWWGYPGVGWVTLSGGAFAIRAVVTPQSSLGSSRVMIRLDEQSPNHSERFFRKVLSDERNLPDMERFAVNRISRERSHRMALHKTATPLGYNIYRSLISPVVVSDLNRVNPDPVETTAYSDSTLVYNGTYYYTVTSLFTQGESVPSNEVSIPVITSVESTDLTTLPIDFAVEQNYPNPFNPETTIKYQLQKRSEVIIKIYNLTGQLVKTLLDKEQPAGYYSVSWNGKDRKGQHIASGVYFYELSAGNFRKVRKMALIR